MRLLPVLPSLPVLHALPVDKAVHIVAKEGKKTNDHRKVGKGMYRGKRPQPDEDDVICGVYQRVISAAQKEEGCRQKAGGDRKRAQPQVRRLKPAKKEVKNDGNCQGKKDGK